MKRLSDKGTDALTIVHKLAGLAWLVCAVAVLVMTVPKLASGRADWATLVLLARIGAWASVLTFVISAAYVAFTRWGFLGSRLLLAKWTLYVVAVGVSGYSISAARDRAVGLLVALAAIQFVVLATCMGIGVYLERSRHAGKLPRPRNTGPVTPAASER